MQLCSYLTWEVVLKCSPGGSRTWDMVRSVSLLNAFYFFSLQEGQSGSSIQLPEKREGRAHIRFCSIGVFCCSCVPASVVVLAAC